MPCNGLLLALADIQMRAFQLTSGQISVLARIEYLDRAAITRMEKTLHPGTTMVITDYAAGSATRTGPYFTVIAEDFKTAGKRRQ